MPKTTEYICLCEDCASERADCDEVELDPCGGRCERCHKRCAELWKLPLKSDE